MIFVSIFLSAITFTSETLDLSEAIEIRFLNGEPLHFMQLSSRDPTLSWLNPTPFMLKQFIYKEKNLGNESIRLMQNDAHLSQMHTPIKTRDPVTCIYLANDYELKIIIKKSGEKKIDYKGIVRGKFNETFPVPEYSRGKLLGGTPLQVFRVKFNPFYATQYELHVPHMQEDSNMKFSVSIGKNCYGRMHIFNLETEIEHYIDMKFVFQVFADDPELW